MVQTPSKVRQSSQQPKETRAPQTSLAAPNQVTAAAVKLPSVQPAVSTSPPGKQVVKANKPDQLVTSAVSQQQPVTVALTQPTLPLAPISKPLTMSSDVFTEIGKSNETQDEIETTDTFTALQSSPPFNSLIIPALEFASQASGSSPLLPPQPTQSTKSEPASVQLNQGQAVTQPARPNPSAASSSINMNLPIGSNLASTLASQQTSQSTQSTSSNSSFLPQSVQQQQQQQQQQQPRFGSTSAYPDLFGYSNLGSQSSLLGQRNILVNQNQFSANSNLISQQARTNQINSRPAQPAQSTQSFQQFPQQPQSQIHHQIEQQLNNFMPGTI